MDAKRLFDLMAAVTVGVLSAPLQAAVALVVRCALGRPVLFRQARPGLHARTFELVKFRTMREPDPSKGWTDDASRMTALGRVLRSTSLDELPTLWNVVKGDMSLVGPRPLLVQYVDRYSATQARRHDVRPGLTGLAQVSGRNTVSWEERLRLDVQYVDDHTFLGDLKILWQTARIVVRREGITSTGCATMPEFKGSDAEAARPTWFESHS